MKTNFQKKQINLPQCQISYLEGGILTETVPILFLHGWGISASIYQEVLDLLGQHDRVIAPDLPGFAGSDPPNFVPDYQQYTEYLLAFLDAIGVAKVHLMGHSLGGGISITLAALAPDRVQSIVLIDSVGVPSGSIPEVLVRRAIEMPAQISLPKLKLQFVDIPQAFTQNLLSKPQNVIQALLLSLEKDLQPLLPKITAPCLLIWAKKDLTTPLSVTENFSKLIPNAQLVAVDEGFHEWCLLYPEEFVAIASRFIRQMQNLSTH